VSFLKGPVALTSPRLRRRLVRCSTGVAVASAIALAFLLLPQPKQRGPTAIGQPGPAQVARPVSTQVRPADRRAIDTTLDRFIPDGVGRQSMTTAWRLAGPEMKAASTLSQWRRDVSPIPYYPVGGRTFHNWTTLDAGPNYVDFGLLISPRRGIHRGSWGLLGEMVRRGPHWLVNNLYIAAAFNQAGVLTGPPDITGQLGPPLPAAKAVLDLNWLIGLVSAILFAVAFTPTLLFCLALRNRLLRRPPLPIPPLPRSVVPLAGGADLLRRSHPRDAATLETRRRS
jgi:hypothetical protein